MIEIYFADDFPRQHTDAAIGALMANDHVVSDYYRLIGIQRPSVPRNASGWIWFARGLC